MAKFIYKMQNILELKEKFEENEKNNYAEKRRMLNDEEDRLKELQGKKRALEEEGKRLRTEDKLDVREIMANTRSKELSEENIKKQRVKVRVAEKNLEAARLRMLEATKERKIHDKLKENAFEEFMAEENAKEIKEIDQLTSYVYGKKDSEE